MIIALGVVQGFQTEIRNKIIGFGSHIQISSTNLQQSFENIAVYKQDNIYQLKDEIDEISAIQVFAHKPAIITTEEEVQGIVLKGVDRDYNWDLFKERIIKGNIIQFNDTLASNDIIISSDLASKLKLEIGSDVIFYFIQTPPRARKLTVSAIYETGLTDIDELFVLADISHIQQLNNWNKSQVGGYEVVISDFSKINEITEIIKHKIHYELDAVPITAIYPQIFDWLGLLDMNVYIIIVLMLLVAGINMITALLIMILERTPMIGILKALGAKNISVRNIFMYNANYIALIGLFFGNLTGLGLIFLQHQFGVITLPQEAYYVSTVPVQISFFQIILLNVGTLFFCTVMTYLPSFLVARITPLKTIRFQ